jgi:perosamine synthetase
MTRYPIGRPYLGKEEERAVVEVVRSGYLSLGHRYIEFEKKFAKQIGSKYACAISSGTAGLHLAMIAAGIKQGDEVITSPFSFVASANCIEYVGAKPIFADIDPVTYNMDPSNVEQLITDKTKAILVVHIFGQATDMDPIMKLARKHNIVIVEDACESLEAKYKGRKVGRFGQSAVFAFYANKQMTTGEGGMLVTDEKKVYKLVCSLRNQGRTPDMQWLDHKYLGYNYRLAEMNAALGIEQLKKLKFLISEKRRIANWYTKYLNPHQQYIALPKVAPRNTHSWFVYVVRLLHQKINRNNLIVRLSKQGVNSKPYLPSIHLFDYYRSKYGYKKNDYPISEKVSDSALALPFYIGLREKDVKNIVDILIKTLF